ncbi:MAG: biotin transporter BioY [Bacteroidota bacterium]|nr:biotin transporter BioY [Bacteroidota bacterium]
MIIKEFAEKNSLSLTIGKIVSSKLFGIVSFSILTAVAAQIAVPVKPVPFTLQTMFVVLAGAFLGSKNGAYSMLLYLAMAAAGLPVLANVPGTTFGILNFAGPTGGYLLAFPAAAFLTGYIVERKSNYLTTVIAMFLGEALVILAGTSFLYTFYVRDAKLAIELGAAMFSLWTVAKVFVAASILYKIKK